MGNLLVFWDIPIGGVLVQILESQLTLHGPSLVPRPSPFFVLRFSFSIIHRSGRVRKTGKAWKHLSREWHLVDARWSYGGRGPRSNNVLDFIIDHSNDSQDSWGLQDQQYLTSLVRNSLYRLLHTSWLMGNAPHTSTSLPPDVIHMIGVPRPSPFFVLFRFRVWYWMKTEEQKMGEVWEQG